MRLVGQRGADDDRRAETDQPADDGRIGVVAAAVVAVMVAAVIAAPLGPAAVALPVAAAVAVDLLSLAPVAAVIRAGKGGADVTPTMAMIAMAVAEAAVFFMAVNIVALQSDPVGLCRWKAQ
ncbi:hypothetical protein [Breoghania sp. L-A4]|uniref:hypothetical protein n=1 Tax=Breoghania sp. L-A4 TaxID=2304600 RepID=UPI0020BD8009|nr:hypothetical protein [Breoghania sp. L-A4]